VSIRPRRPRNRLSELLAIGLLVGPTACILVVKDDATKLSDRCHFVGDDTTACGICIAHSCQTQVDACCSSKSCRDDGAFTLTKPLELLDQCSSGSSYSCRVPSLVSESSTEGAIFACIQSSCAAECASGDGGTVTDAGKKDGSSTTSRTSCSSYSTDSCTCSGSAPYNDTPCDITTVKNSLCCADYGWPGSGLRCSCDRWECRQTSSSTCECSSTTTGPSTTCNGTYCCRSYSSCRCSNTPCSTYDDEVASCDIEYQECSTASNDIKVSSCAVPY
jgi:hypothetical protein